MKFGPDIQWITDPTDYSVNDAHLDDVYAAVTQYLPNIDRSALAGDYTGIRYDYRIPVFNEFVFEFGIVFGSGICCFGGSGISVLLIPRFPIFRF